MSVRWKKTRSPGWEPGNHWVTCDMCGCSVRHKDVKKTWDGLVVCRDTCWEPRHPQDFVRGVPDDTSAKGLVRPEPQDTFVDVEYLPASSTVPEGTFDNTL